MNVTSRVRLKRENGASYPDRTVDLSITVQISNASRGDAVVGSLDETWKGARAALLTTLERS